MNTKELLKKGISHVKEYFSSKPKENNLDIIVEELKIPSLNPVRRLDVISGTGNTTIVYLHESALENVNGAVIPINILVNNLDLILSNLKEETAKYKLILSSMWRARDLSIIGFFGVADDKQLLTVQDIYSWIASRFDGDNVLHISPTITIKGDISTVIGRDLELINQSKTFGDYLGNRVNAYSLQTSRVYVSNSKKVLNNLVKKPL